MDRRTTALLTVVLGGFPVLLLYTALHEGGHALVALAHGAEVTGFVIGLDAHVSYVGGTAGPLGWSLVHAAGVLLPVLVLVVALAAYRPQVRSGVYQGAYLLTTIVITSSVLAWVAIPVVAVVGQAPPGDDVTEFLLASDFPPLLLSLVALGVVAWLVVFAVVRGLPRGFVATVRPSLPAG